MTREDVLQVLKEELNVDLHLESDNVLTIRLLVSGVVVAEDFVNIPSIPRGHGGE